MVDLGMEYLVHLQLQYPTGNQLAALSGRRSGGAPTSIEAIWRHGVKQRRFSPSSG